MSNAINWMQIIATCDVDIAQREFGSDLPANITYTHHSCVIPSIVFTPLESRIHFEIVAWHSSEWEAKARASRRDLIKMIGVSHVINVLITFKAEVATSGAVESLQPKQWHIAQGTSTQAHLAYLDARFVFCESSIFSRISFFPAHPRCEWLGTLLACEQAINISGFYEQKNCVWERSDAFETSLTFG